MTVFAGERHCGFGDVRFGVLWTGNDVSMPGWEQEGYVATVHVPGGDVNETFLLGQGPLVTTYRLMLDSVADYRELIAARQTQGTLTVYQRMCELPGREVVWFGDVYTELDDVTLIAVSDVRVMADGGGVECSATFQLQERPA